MTDQVLIEILDMCISADTKAAEAYLTLAQACDDPDQAGFWEGMSEEETVHVGYWKKLLDLARSGMIPEIFDRPFQVSKELETILVRVEDLARECSEACTVSNSFLLAFRLEFYLLQPALVTLLHYLSGLPGEESVEQAYEEHLEGFVRALSTYGGESTELALLGEALRRLWRQNRDLAELSNTDELTGVLNRRGLFNTITPLAYLAQRNDLTVGIVMVDIDDFKEINDRQGHQAGDRALQKVAKILKSLIRASDVIGRYGGEEFLLYFSEVTPGFMNQIGEKMRKRIEEEMAGTETLTISAGIAADKLGKDVDKDLRALIKKADQGLYQAKRAGKNRVMIFD